MFYPTCFETTPKAVVMKSMEPKLQLILLNFYGIKRHTCKELELPLLSSQVHISFIFIVEKRVYSVRKT